MSPEYHQNIIIFIVSSDDRIPLRKKRRCFSYCVPTISRFLVFSVEYSCWSSPIVLHVQVAPAFQYVSFLLPLSSDRILGGNNKNIIMLTINISIPMGITIKSIIIFPRSLKYSSSYPIHPYSIHSQLPSYRHNIPCVLTIPYTFPLHSPVWMEEILHELIGGLSHYRVISILSLPQDFATIQNSCGNQCHRYSL